MLLNLVVSQVEVAAAREEIQVEGYAFTSPITATQFHTCLPQNRQIGLECFTLSHLLVSVPFPAKMDRVFFIF